MKLYIYDHCPFCTKARMIFGLKSLPVDVSVLLEDDVETPTRLVGKKSLPILQKPDGTHMLESMDIVHYVDSLDGSIIVTQGGDERIKAWHDDAWATILPLTLPRLASADLQEFATPQARSAFITRQSSRIGDFDDLIRQTPRLLEKAELRLTALDPLLETRTQIDADDFLIYPQLRMLSIVKELHYPVNVRRYLVRLEQATGVPLYHAQAS